MNIVKISNNISLTNETNEIIKESKGFRSEIPFGSGVRCLEDIIDFEIGDLGNSDIVLFCNNAYNLDLDLECSVEEDDEDFEEEFDSMIQENHTYYKDELMDFVESAFGCNKEDIKGLWLAKEDIVANSYCKGLKDKCIDAYILPSNYLILSDLGHDGVLIAYTEEPLKLASNY